MIKKYKYRVPVTVVGDSYIYVKAVCKEQARDVAKELIEHDQIRAYLNPDECNTQVTDLKFHVSPAKYVEEVKQ